MSEQGNKALFEHPQCGMFSRKQIAKPQSQRSKIEEVADGAAGANNAYFCHLISMLKLIWYLES